jgi:1-hydroxy-2-methyl-2-(E)-butenyl 4-diphosphate synthase
MVRVPLVDGANCLRAVATLVAAGCQLIRFAVPNRRELAAFAHLCPRLPRDSVAYVADLHFGSSLAVDALQYFDKVRINPGNFGHRRTPPPDSYGEESYRRERDGVELCARNFFRRAREMGRAVRIGCNGGSVAARMRWLHRGATGTDDALLASAWEFLRWAREEKLSAVVLSLKASDCLRTVALNREARRRMDAEGWDVPLHIGVTEAGSAIAGRVRAAIGIGALLSDGLGDTLRVSLTEREENEMEVARQLLHCAATRPLPPVNWESLAPELVATGGRAIGGDADDPLATIWSILHQIAGAGPGARLTVPPGDGRLREIVEEIFQACGWGSFHTEIISCPACGRTGYNVAAVADELHRRLGNFPGLRVAVMGCVVNGVGEMGDADYGYIGSGKNTVNLYHRGVCVREAIPEKNAIDVLEQLIHGDPKVP